MPKYRLSVDETRNSLKYVEIETSLSETELDALLTKIENDNELSCGEDLAKKLQAQDIKITAIIPSTHDYYVKAETLEIEGLEEPQEQGFVITCKACDLTPGIIEQAMLVITSRLFEGR